MVICAAKPMNSARRPTSAGFAKLVPMPPNSCFATTMAAKQPTTAVHSGILAGRLHASITPVTSAEQSFTADGRFASRQNNASNTTQLTAHTATTSHARAPNIMPEATTTGMSAMSTWIISPCVELPSWICGEADTKNFSRSISFACLSLHCLCKAHRLRHRAPGRAHEGAAAAAHAQIHHQLIQPGGVALRVCARYLHGRKAQRARLDAPPAAHARLRRGPALPVFPEIQGCRCSA